MIISISPGIPPFPYRLSLHSDSPSASASFASHSTYTDVSHTCPDSQPPLIPTVIRNALNLHGYPLGQLLDRDTAPRGLVRKVLLEHAVHLGEVRHVVQKHVYFDDLLDRGVGLLQDGEDVLAALRGLVGDAAADQGAGFVGGDLARDVDVGAGDYGLGLGWGVLVVGLRGELGGGVRARCEGRWNGRVGLCSPCLGIWKGSSVMEGCRFERRVVVQGSGCIQGTYVRSGNCTYISLSSP